MINKRTKNLVPGLWLFLKGPVLSILGASLLVACTGAEQDQTVADLPIAYIKRPIPIEPNSNPPVPVDPDVREPAAFNSGGNLFIRDSASPSASEQNITSCLTTANPANNNEVDGDVKDVEASYDGTKLIFSLIKPHDPNNNDDPATRETWDIYEYDTTVGGCPTRIINSDIEARKGQDVAPAYLPGGRIVFSSSRQDLVGAIQLDEGGKPQFPPLDEDQDQETVVLHVMNSGGTGIQQISFNQSHDLDPSVLSTGEILFSRWDHMGARNVINLYKVRPDGTELKVLYGAHAHNVGTGGSTVQFLSARELENGRILGMIKPFSGSAGGGAPVVINAAQFADNNQPIWPYQGAGLTGNGQVNAVSLGVTTDNSISPAGRFRSVYPLLDGSNRALVSWTQCRLQLVDAMGVPLPDPPEPCLGQTPAIEAFPLYGIYVYDLNTNTQLPVVIPQEGFIFDEPVVMAPRSEPTILTDKATPLIFGLDQTLSNESVGLLHIRSVYDMDGNFNDLDTTISVSDLAAMSDPTQTNADTRPARFLRVVKGAYIPEEVRGNDLDNAAFGVSRQQGMRELLGYAPIEPDGSVLVKVPANVPFAISVVDKDGRRIGARHQNWLQLRKGQILQCNGCHDHNPPGNPAPDPKPHGYTDDPVALNMGAQSDVVEFPGTDPAVIPELYDTMAMTRIRTACGADVNGPLGLNVTKVTCAALTPNINLRFTDVWTDPAGSPTADLDILYTDLSTLIPQNAGSAFCQPASWEAKCRVMINYEESIHPLWSLSRTVAMVDRTCTNCHTNTAQVPDAQLDLTDGASDLDNDHFKSYRELLSADNEVDVNGLDVLVPQIVRDVDGNIVYRMVVDPVTGLLVPELDPITMLPIPLTQDVPVPVPGGPSISRAGSQFGRFMGKFTPGGSHAGDITAAEIRLLAEWIDMGAQYFNNPFHIDVPTN